MSEGEEGSRPKISRRDFLRKSAKVAGGVAVAGILKEGFDWKIEGHVTTLNMEEIAEKIERKKGPLIKNPIARFNLGLDKSNPDWLPKEKNVVGEHLPPAPDLNPSPELLKELSTPERLSDPETGQKLNTLRLNWAKFKSNPAKRAMLFLPPFNNEIDAKTNNYRLQQLAIQTGLPIIAIDHPQVGDSDKLTKPQRDDLEKNKSYAEIAKAQLRIMQQLGIKEIDMVSQSMGAWAQVFLAEAAPEYGIKIKNLVLVESPLFDNEKVIAAGKKLAITEGQYIDLYQSHPADPEMMKAGELNRSTTTRNVKGLAWLMSAFKNAGLDYFSAMAVGGVSGHLQKALDKNPGMRAHVVHGTLSTISTAEANKALRENLKAKYKDRFHEVLFPGEPHVVLENAKRFATTVKEIITG